MGVAWYIVPEREVPGLDHHVDGKLIAHAPEKKLDEIYAERKVQPLMNFFSMDPAELADFLDTEELPEEADVAEQWFKASDGLKTVRALLGHLRDHPDALPRSADIVADLEEFERVLAALAKAKVRWHLAIDI